MEDVIRKHLKMVGTQGIYNIKVEEPRVLNIQEEYEGYGGQHEYTVRATFQKFEDVCWHRDTTPAGYEHWAYMPHKCKVSVLESEDRFLANILKDGLLLWQGDYCDNLRDAKEYVLDQFASMEHDLRED